MSKLKEAREKKEAQNAEASMEEGEEGMIISDAENSQLSGSSDSDLGVNPTEKKLIEKYEKYPEYLKVTFKKPDWKNKVANLNINNFINIWRKWN